MRKILHPTDFSECSEAAREQAAAFARSLSAEVILLHVLVEAPLYSEGWINAKDVRRVYDAERKWVEETLEVRAAEMRQAGVATRWKTEVGNPFEEIVLSAEEEGVDLVVMGTHGWSGLDRLLLGSVADRVIRTAPCPVVTVRAPKNVGGR